MALSSWWDEFFDEKFADLLLEPSPINDRRQEVNFIVNELAIKKGDLVFDQCCGSGEISCALGRNGIHVIGIDQSKPYIARAKRKALNEQLPCTFYVEDAFDFYVKEKCDFVLNWYTSFGYSDNDNINLKMLKCAANSLKSGGKFILDYTNPAYIFQNFINTKIIRKTLENGDELLVLKESDVDLERGMLISSWTYFLPNGKKETKVGESRIYFPSQLKEFFESSGFCNIKFKGDIFGSKLTKDSQRCIVIAEKS